MENIKYTDLIKSYNDNINTHHYDDAVNDARMLLEIEDSKENNYKAGRAYYLRGKIQKDSRESHLDFFDATQHLRKALKLQIKTPVNDVNPDFVTKVSESLSLCYQVRGKETKASMYKELAQKSAETAKDMKKNFNVDNKTTITREKNSYNINLDKKVH